MDKLIVNPFTDEQSVEPMGVDEIAALAALLGKSAEEVDNLFTLAATL